MRRHWGSILVIALAIAITAYAYLADRDKVSDLERERRAHLVFPAFRKDALTMLEIEHGSDKMRFEATDTDGGDREWKMTLPAGEKGDSIAIDRLLSTLEYASYARKVASGGSGFDPPRLTGTLAMKGLTYRFALGGPASPPDGGAYFRIDGEGMFVIARELVADLMKPSDAYRDRSVVPLLSIDLSRLDVTGPESWSIARVDDVSFKFVPPTAKYQGIRVSRTALDKVWGALADMRAEAFPKEDEAARALQKTAFTIGMTPTSTSLGHALLVLGGACESAPADVVLERREPTHLVTCVPASVLGGMATPVDELVDRHPFAAITEEALEVVLEDLGSATKIEIARKGNGWHERAPADRDLDGEPGDMATGLVKSLVTAQGDLLATPPAGFSPTVRAKITRAETNVVETIEASGNVVHRLADGAYLTMPDWFAHRMKPSADAFRTAAVWSAPIDAAIVQDMKSDCAGVSQEIDRDASGTFHLTIASKKMPVDGGNAIAVAEAIERARATSWMGKDDGTFGFDHGCSVALDLGADAGLAHVVLRLGGDAPDGEVFARANDDPAVFTVSRALSDLAKTLLVDRSVFFVDADSIADVDVSNGAAHARFTTSETDDGGTGEAVIAAIGALRAERAVHAGAPLAAEGFAKPTLDVRVRSKADAGTRALHFTLGAKDGDRYFARADGVDATFSVSESSVRPLLDAIEKRGP